MKYLPELGNYTFVAKMGIIAASGNGANCPAAAADTSCAAALIEKFTITLPEIDSLCYNAISVYNR